MENYISLLLAIQLRLGNITEKEAEKIDKELRNTTIPGTFSEAKIVVNGIFDKIQNK